MATVTIKHASLTGAAANPDVLVDGPKWDASHTVTGLENVPNVDTTNASNLTSGTVPAARMPALTGDVTTSAGAVATTLSTVNSNVGTFGSATQAAQITTNGKGLLTAAANVTITPAIGSVTGLGTGVSTFLATPSSANLRAALTDEVGTGAAYFVGGALGTPASATLTNATGLPLSTGVVFTVSYPVGNSTNDIRYVGPTNFGQLTWSSTTALAFLPYNGDTIRIGGTVFQIPAAGIAGLGNPTSVFLNGVAAQTLAINTTYYIYAFSNSGTVTADFSTTGHATSSTAGNIGTEIKSADNTRTLIGMVRTGGTVIYASDLQTASWFNRRNKKASTTQSLAAAGNSTALNFVTWADEAFSIGTAGFLSNSGVFISIWQDRIDASNVGDTSQGTIFAANGQLILNSQKWVTATEGNHSYDSNLSATGGTPSAGGTSQVMIRG